MPRVSVLPGPLRRHAALVAVAATGLACTLAAWLFVRSVVRAQQDMRFGEVVSASTATLRDRLAAHIEMLRAARGAVEALGHAPDAEEFRAFAQSLGLSDHVPGIQGLGWTVALPRDALARHEAAERAAGRTGYRVWPEGDRPFYGAIVFLYPLDWRNARAIGFDMYSEPIRRAAMERARDTGDVAASRKVELVQDDGAEWRAGFILCAAVLARPSDPASLVGWVHAGFRSSDLITAALAGQGAHGVALSVFAADAPDPAELLHEDGGRPAPTARVLETRIPVAGRTWLLRFAAQPGFASRTERLLPPATLVLGIALTALLSWITHTEVRGRRRAERTARRTAFLASAGKALSGSLDYDRTLGRTARLAAGRVADACVICVLDPGGPLWRVAHRDPAVARALADALEAAGIDAAALQALPATRGRTRRAPAEVPPARTTPALARALAGAGLVNAVTAPLRAREEALGTVTFLHARGRPPTRADAALVEDVAYLASAAVDTARLYRRAQDAVRARDEFLSIASHELKTPLTSLGLQSESLVAAARREGSESLERKSQVVRRNVERLGRLVASLLDLSRISAGRLELEIEDVDLAALARDVVERFEEEASRAECTLELDAPEPVVGRWDRLRLDQVLTNLLSNAVKYGPGRPVTVTVSSDGSRATLVVRDRGIGVATADHHRIFERFERAVSRRNYGGFGLGLWIVRQIVEALGGQVSVESAPGTGSTFTVRLPCVADVQAPRPEQRPPAPVP